MKIFQLGFPEKKKEIKFELLKIKQSKFLKVYVGQVVIVLLTKRMSGILFTRISSGLVKWPKDFFGNLGDIFTLNIF